MKTTIKVNEDGSYKATGAKAMGVSAASIVAMGERAIKEILKEEEAKWEAKGDDN